MQRRFGYYGVFLRAVITESYWVKIVLSLMKIVRKVAMLSFLHPLEIEIFPVRKELLLLPTEIVKNTALFTVLKTFNSPGGAGPQYLNNRLNPIFAFSTFKNTIPALDRVLYSSGSAGNQHNYRPPRLRFSSHHPVYKYISDGVRLTWAT